MDRLKELINNYSRWTNLSNYIIRIEYQIDNDITAAIGSTKSLLESICKTILDHEKVEYDRNDNINKLAKKTIHSFNIENPDKISLFGNALVTSIHNLGELRNYIDESSHGKSLFDKTQKIDSITALFLINSAETIACFLIEFYEIEHPRKKGENEFRFEEMQDFNDYIDNEYGYIEIAKISYATSEALFAIDKTAYKDEYRKYLEVVNEQTN
ncbi:abortive infection family protein [Aphanizomenon flos-aquae NRERC-008]|uniref:Abortive infection family protein n=2 Tax=Aphanizomenon flos-aquae TaxID=1176 RepID=A0ABR8IRH6_APHFL|nr:MULTISPECIES: abortive infection family protein [Aphanizomenon]MBD2389758.1 abortive infection family protein [Aphanizomenon flos-aquae FACHB-1171]MBD2556947.1 abortive infection family protein [Aphanizomenon flos-aquae FACHB-1290]MBD2631297.1 abortive infection family protein [Aphanizomenon sp. FACHB-1399]MBD2642997.1 abortive infection family protein [Aphanizomenon sp. FACHB-1401]MBD2655991.1 abortive infection family protein [Aphanizomenon flos-aquae FACHB-1265]